MNNSIYENIIRDKLGSNFIKQSNDIKEMQCYHCRYKNKSKCRLKIEKNRCKNYINKNII